MLELEFMAPPLIFYQLVLRVCLFGRMPRFSALASY
jgi:hypothetical protein